jgi:hypothetical protein
MGKLIGGVVVMACVLAAGCGTAQPQKTTQDPERAARDIATAAGDDQPAATETTTDDTAGGTEIPFGQAGVDDDVTFKLMSFERVDRIATGPYSSDGPIRPQHGAALYAATVVYKNNMSVSIDLLCGGAEGFKLIDRKVRNYDAIDRLIEIPENDQICSREVQPGFKTRAVIPFEMPARGVEHRSTERLLRGAVVPPA